MSFRSHPVRALGAASALTLSLIAAAGPAAADPPAMNDQCAILLTQAAHWPSGGVPGHRGFSDGYESHLLRQPACAHHRR